MKAVSKVHKNVAPNRAVAARPPVIARIEAIYHQGLTRIGMMGVSRRELSQLFRQLAAMLEAGLSLERSLEILIAQTSRPPLHQALDAILDKIRAGLSLHKAVSTQSRLFPGIAPQMIKVGEAGGVLTDMLYRVSEYLEHEHEISTKVLSALAYPGIVFLFAAASVLGISFYILPMFAELYASCGVPLPFLTVLVIKTGLLIRDYGAFLAAMLLLGGFFMRRACTSPRWAPAIHQRLLCLPLMGRMAAGLAVLQMTEMLAVLLRVGVPALNALETAGTAAGNLYFRRIIAETCQNMRAGQSIAASLASYRQFDEMFVRMIAAGEESGSLAEMLTALSRYLQKDLIHKLDSIIALLEPALILTVAFLVGATVVATLLPMYSLMNLAAGI